MLSLLLIIPLLGCIYLLPIDSSKLENISYMKKIALFTSLLNLIISILIWIEFDSSTTEYQFVLEFKELNFCHLNIGIDGTSLYFVLLTTFITPLCLLSNWSDDAATKENIKYFLISFLILETLQIAVFVVLDLLLFYVFFESVLIPLFIIILTWGASVSRIRAAFLLFLYTLGGSLFMLLAIITIQYYHGSTDFQLISISEISLESQKILWLSPSFSKRNMTSSINKDSKISGISSTNPDRNSDKRIVIYGWLRRPHATNLSSTVNYTPFNSKLRRIVKPLLI